MGEFRHLSSLLERSETSVLARPDVYRNIYIFFVINMSLIICQFVILPLMDVLAIFVSLVRTAHMSDNFIYCDVIIIVLIIFIAT